MTLRNQLLAVGFYVPCLMSCTTEKGSRKSQDFATQIKDLYQNLIMRQHVAGKRGCAAPHQGALREAAGAGRPPGSAPGGNRRTTHSM